MSKELKVNMFGTFSLSYDVQLLTGKNKSSESGFISLMEAVLHAGEKVYQEMSWNRLSFRMRT